ncbi:MAG: S8 family peptidase [Deltaproteobacteria bacterium]|nr:S8 family peptidase [Deltaproteobacteria bacterium]
MSDREVKHRPHLIVESTARPQRYVHPSGGGPKTRLPSYDREALGERLLRRLDAVRDELDAVHDRRRAVGVVGDRGLCLEFESAPEFELALKSLERSRLGIELFASSQRGSRMCATVLVPEGRLAHFTRLVQGFMARDDPRSGRPKHENLLARIADIRRAAFASFWTDDEAVLPGPDESAWWEVWLRGGDQGDAVLSDFRALAEHEGLQLPDSRLDFLDRTVVLAFGTREQMSASVELLDCVAELRRAKELPTFFSEMPSREQRKWVDDLLRRLRRPRHDAPAACVLDTGTNNGHPLLAPALPNRHLLTCNPAWGAGDHAGHGTEMAGLALFGDLVKVLPRSGPVALEHRLESVKLLPPPPATNPRELHGWLTVEATSRIEIAQPGGRRVFNLAVTAPDFRDGGAPSSWSAKLDDLAAGADGGPRRLFVVAAGNVPKHRWPNYPAVNEVEQVHDPAQAWNALTVGAYTERVLFDQTRYPGWRPLAHAGALAPASTTSVGWSDIWPNKPDVVMEGGNAIIDPTARDVDVPDDLSLLTTYWRLTEKLFISTGDTSAATAQVTRMAAILMGRYPQLWPEAVRALIVHSARWTATMRADIETLPASQRTRTLLRRYGLGVPDLDRASWSASNALTLIAQDSLVPFERGSSRGRTKDMNVHSLPWPRDELLALGATEVEMRVTLSYFVEPNPARRGWKYRHRYPSHGLRFAVRKPGEPLTVFSQRVSKAARDEDMGQRFEGESGWIIGPMQRHRGSLHSDRRSGPAADIADCSHLAVYPVTGWWKERGRFGEAARYALVVSIHTPETAADIYTPVATRITLAAAVET